MIKIFKIAIYTLILSLFSACGGTSSEEPTQKLVEEPVEKKEPIQREEEPINNIPVADIAEKISRENGVSINFIGNAYDADNDTLSFKWTEAGTILSTNQNFTKDDFAVGEHTITFTVTDTHGAIDSDEMTITIVAANTVNDRPTTVDQNIETDEDNAVTFELNANDIEGDTLTMEIISQPSHGQLEGTMPNFTYTPDANFRGSDEITYTVNDGNLTSNEATVYILIRNVNDAPTVNAGVDKKIRVGHDIWISGSANDSDGDIVKYEWKKGNKILSNAQSFRYTPTTVGNHELTLSVTDNENAKSSDSVVINATNKLPLVIIQIEFNDYQLHSNSSVWSKKIFGTDEGELNHYYNEISYGRLQFEKAKESQGVANDGIITVRLNINHPGNGVNLQEFLPQVIELTNNYIDYSIYDENKDKAISNNELQIMFLMAGGENATGLYPGIWAHAHCIYGGTKLDDVNLMMCHKGTYSIFGESHFEHGNDATIGIIAHELGHSALGLIDLYDRDKDSEGIGNFGLMGSGNWGQKSFQENAGATPVHMTGWNKVEAKFITAETITDDVSNLEFRGTSFMDYQLYKITTQNPNEYFLVENRANHGYDRGLFVLKDGSTPVSIASVMGPGTAAYFDLNINMKIIKFYLAMQH